MERLIQRLDQWLQQNCPDYYTTLQPAVEQNPWSGLEQSVGVVLPDEFKRLYQWRNGDALHHGQYEQMGFWFSYNWMPRHRAIDARETLNQLLDYGEFALENWWNPRWVPFFEFNNNYLCLDMAGCWTGQVGQVVEYDRPTSINLTVDPAFMEFSDGFSVTAAMDGDGYEEY